MQGDFEIGGCLIHARINRVNRCGKEIRIRPRSMRVLIALAQSEGDVVTKGDLIDSVWKGADVSQDSLTQSIVELRKALGDDARKPRVIETIHRVGYRLLHTPTPIATPRLGGWTRRVKRSIAATFVLGVAVLAGQDPKIALEMQNAPASSVAVPLFAISSSDSGDQYPADAYQQYLLGQHHLRTRLGSWLSEARGSFERAVAIDPTFADAYAALAGTYLIFEETPRSYSEFDTDLELAKEYVQQALEIQPGLAEALLARAQIARIEVDPDAEERNLRAALAANPNLVDAYVALGEHLVARLLLDEALEVYDAANAIDPLNPKVAIATAKLIASRGDYHGAIERLLTALEKAPPSPAVYASLVTLSAEYGDYVRRLRWAIDWVRMAPRSATAAAELGDTYSELGAPALADMWLRHAIALSPQASFKAEMRRLAIAKQYEAMLELTRPLIPRHLDDEMSPEQSAPTALAGLTYIFLGHYEIGTQLLEETMRFSPTISQRSFYQRLYGRNVLITAYQLSDQTQAAARVLVESREIERQIKEAGAMNHPQMLRQLARLHSLDGNGQMAIELLTDAVDKGWRSAVLEGPPETDSMFWRTIADDPRYQTLMQSVRQDVDEMRRQADAAGLLVTPTQLASAI